MVFLAWAWRDSRVHDSWLLCQRHAWRSGWDGVILTRWNGVISPEVEVARVARGEEGRERDFLQQPFFLRAEGEFTAVPVWSRKEETAGMRSLYELSRLEMRHEPVGTWQLYVPYWLMMVVVALGCGGILGWRVRRWGKLR